MPAGTVGVFPVLSTSGSSGAFTGTATFPASAAMPTATITTDSTTVKAPSGESAYLGATTGFGMNFGSSRSQPYLSLSTAAAFSASTTNVLFPSQPASGWGFAVGDIDADWVHIVPLDSAGNPLPASELHAQDTGGTPLLNYCAAASPKPSACVGSGPFTDAPWWLENGGLSPAPGDTTVYPAGSVVGNGFDTNGAYDWFLPSAAVWGIRLEFSAKIGFPSYQLWLAAPAEAVVITGTVEIPDAAGAPIPGGTLVQLDNADGTPVLDIEDEPVTIPVAADGTFAIETEWEPGYELVVIPPPGYLAPDPVPVPIPAGATSVVVPPIALDPIVTPTSTPAAPEPNVAAALPPTGVDVVPWLIAGGIVLVAGVALLLVVRLGGKRK